MGLSSHPQFHARVLVRWGKMHVRDGKLPVHGLSLEKLKRLKVDMAIHVQAALSTGPSDRPNDCAVMNRRIDTIAE